uniref:Uncharacterized protein n=1 Tax=Arundo donax TaxID=35708 RepID=A0A0A9E3D1_ARUDO
MRRRPWEDS